MFQGAFASEAPMNKDQLDFLRSLHMEPAIIEMQQTCWLLNIHLSAGFYLVRKKHLVPLGNPPLGAQKYFSTRYIKALAEDEQWLNKAAKLIREYHQTRNAGRMEAGTDEGGNHE